jgi:hypothetical protein
MDRNTPTTIKLRKDIDGVEWPADWDFSYRGADLIAERAAVRFFELYSFDRMNRRLFSMVKSAIAIAMTEAQGKGIVTDAQVDVDIDSGDKSK